jgi:SAM-dependent methyltransferase
MPTSDYHQISDVLHVVEQCQPRSVLDVGVGFGKWGVLCRDVLEVYHERMNRPDWTARVDGIEIHDSYRNDLWRYAYDNVHVGNAAQVLTGLGHYDLILCCDVIEHFEKNEGLDLLRLMLQHGEVVVITSPRGYSPQGPTHSNEYQTHLSGWSRDDFRDVPHIYKDIGFTFMAVVSSAPERLKGIEAMHPLRALGVKKGAAAVAKLALQRARQRVFR